MRIKVIAYDPGRPRRFAANALCWTRPSPCSASTTTSSTPSTYTSPNQAATCGASAWPSATRCDFVGRVLAGERILGAIVLGDKAPDYIDQPADGREIYISGFITSRAPGARAAGQLLLRHAKARQPPTGPA